MLRISLMQALITTKHTFSLNVMFFTLGGGSRRVGACQRVNLDL